MTAAARRATARFAAAALVAVALPSGEAGGQSLAGAAGAGAQAEERVEYGWSIRPIDGDPIALEAYHGRVLFINAWASWCTPCVREMAGIERLAGRLADTDVAFLLVAVDREASVRRHLRLHPLSLPVFLEDDPFPPVLGLRGVPMSWIVDREGRIVVRHFGAAQWDTPAVETFLQELAKEP